MVQVEPLRPELCSNSRHRSYQLPVFNKEMLLSARGRITPQFMAEREEKNLIYIICINCTQVGLFLLAQRPAMNFSPQRDRPAKLRYRSNNENNLTELRSFSTLSSRTNITQRFLAALYSNMSLVIDDKNFYFILTNFQGATGFNYECPNQSPKHPSKATSASEEVTPMKMEQNVHLETMIFDRGNLHKNINGQLTSNNTQVFLLKAQK